MQSVRPAEQMSSISTYPEEGWLFLDRKKLLVPGDQKA